LGDGAPLPLPLPLLLPFACGGADAGFWAATGAFFFDIAEILKRGVKNIEK
jgi:hypothetical protein